MVSLCERRTGEGGAGTAADIDTPRMVARLYLDLRRIARRQLAAERDAWSWQATSLTHEAVARLLSHHGNDTWDSPGHFVAAASRTMRRLLIDAARKRKTERAGGRMARRDVALDQLPDGAGWEEMILVGDLLDRLAESSASAALVFELRYFCRLTVPETAAAAGLGRRTVDRRWEYACAWIQRELALDGA